MPFSAGSDKSHGVWNQTVVQFQFPLGQGLLPIRLKQDIRKHIAPVEHLNLLRIPVEGLQILPDCGRRSAEEFFPFLLGVIFEHILLAAVLSVLLQIEVLLAVFFR